MKRDKGITRRTFFAETATMAIGASAVGSAGLAGSVAAATPPGDQEKRRKQLEEFLRIFPHSRKPRTGRINAYDQTWEDWVKRTGALPPGVEGGLDAQTVYRD